MATFLKAYWQDIVMINYEVPKETLIPYLPGGVEPDDFEGRYYVSLVGFQFLKSSLFGIPIPYFGSFEEVNLRFYVRREANKSIRRGVVFISEIVPHKIVAYLANRLYKEHYSCAEMNSTTSVVNQEKRIQHSWENDERIFYIKASFENQPNLIIGGSHEEFIYEHFYGYTRINNQLTWEYKVDHIRWETNKNISFEVKCDFEKLYGPPFAFLNKQQPHSVYNAIGSRVSIDWKINKIKNETPQKTRFSN